MLILFSKKKFPTLVALTAVSDITVTTLCCMKTTSRIFQFSCYDHFQDFSAPITYAKKFGFLAGVVCKIFAIKNALATNRNVLLQQNHNVITEIIQAKNQFCVPTFFRQVEIFWGK